MTIELVRAIVGVFEQIGFSSDIVIRIFYLIKTKYLLLKLECCIKYLPYL